MMIIPNVTRHKIRNSCLLVGRAFVNVCFKSTGDSVKFVAWNMKLCDSATDL